MESHPVGLRMLVPTCDATGGCRTAWQALMLGEGGMDGGDWLWKGAKVPWHSARIAGCFFSSPFLVFFPSAFTKQAGMESLAEKALTV